MTDPTPYRLVLDDGTERVALVLDESEPGLPYYRAWGEGWRGYLAADTARGAAAKVAAQMERTPRGSGVGLPVVEILAPREPSRRELAEAPDKLRARTVAALDNLSLARVEPILAFAVHRASDTSVDPVDALLWCVGVLSVELGRVRGVAQRAAERKGLPALRVVVDALAGGDGPGLAEKVRRATLGEFDRMPLLRGTAAGPAVHHPDGTYRVELRVEPLHHPDAFAAGAEAMRAQANDALTSEDLLDAAAVVRRLPLPTPPAPSKDTTADAR